ncbi:alpha/beta fold hydrolase, partial [Streptomyces sp. NPDC001156]
AVLGVVDRPPVHAVLGRVSVPPLVVVGADDVATPRADAERIAAVIDGARLEVVTGSGHSSTLEQPAAITALIRDFLTSVDDG